MNERIKWAARCWHWRKESQKDGDEDLAIAQIERWHGAPNEALARRAGERIAAHPQATSPGLYDLMRGTPDQNEPDGILWEVFSEVRP